MDPATGVAIGSTVLELEKRAQNTIIRHVKYITDFKNNMIDFLEKLELFEARINDIQEMVYAYRRNLQEPRNEVKVFLKRCTEFKEKYAGDLENLKGLNLESMKYFSRYKLSKKAINLEKRMTKLMLNMRISIEFAALNPPPEAVVKINNKYVEGLNSVEKNKADIISAIKDVNTVVIGLYGMGGIGKTTLIQQINNEFKNDPHIRFTYVIMVTVSYSPNIKKLQDQIGERVGLNFQGIESETVRARRLLERLEKEKSIMIILDDVWNALDLNTIGIPRDNGENKCCKIILTTRYEDVCTQMNASTKILMACLNRNEAWNLFKSYSGVFESDSTRKIAEDVCKECAGLPLAISVVASTLRHKKRETVWSNFLSKMKESNFKELGGLFPEDYEIYVNDLMCYGLGEGFVTCGENVSSLDYTLILIEELKSRGLLLDVEGRDEMFVKMHDVVRHVAISIARNDEKLDFYSNFKDLTKWPEGGESETIKRISLMENSIRHIVDHNPKFHGKRMKSLLLNGNMSLETIADDFFEEMDDLHILDMNNTGLISLPTSFQKLMKLRVLMIYNLQAYLPARISLRDHLLSKKDLVVLILGNSRIPELTKEFGELVHLKVLDFTDTIIDIIRPNVLSKLKKLEQLRMLGSFNQWNIESNKDGNFVSFYELGSLERLYTLEVEVFDEKFAMSSKEELLNFLSSLKFFRISVNDIVPNRSYHEPDKRLLLRSNEVSESVSNWIMVLMKKAEKLHLNGCNISKQFLRDKIFGYSYNFKYLQLTRCKTSKVLIEFSENKDCDAVILPKLKNIILDELDEMENIFIIPIEIPVGSFQSLKEISIENCQALRSIFPWNVAVCLVHLEYLRVRNCSSLEYVIVMGKEDNSDYYNNGQNLKSLLWQQESEKRMEMELSSLMYLGVFNCPKLKRLFFGEKSAPELPTFHCSSEEWFDELQWEDEQAASRFKSIVRFDAVEGRASSRPLKTKRLNI
ncbi:NB-ARC domain-containing disease resistance protein [Zostera marina]|uniref:NB-ARC domain-containing disease resistance protein n=1 Tax=Zostera marina TaxID=29655 RepID=A0A0K9NJ90_ZOSMR|nr:NB-ARC domain-containing disease resistance protein [Zostera marina]